MFKKSLLIVSLVVSAMSFASENNDGKKYGFDNNAKHTGYIITGNQIKPNYINVQSQYGYDESPEYKRERELRDKEEAYQRMSRQNHDGCVIN
jgi:hypothetical protein